VSLLLLPVVVAFVFKRANQQTTTRTAANRRFAQDANTRPTSTQTNAHL
jgi:3-deoxy-D-manno-octulosonic-acid transferase